jgi:hypothetical protein
MSKSDITIGENNTYSFKTQTEIKKQNETNQNDKNDYRENLTNLHNLNNFNKMNKLNSLNNLNNKNDLNSFNDHNDLSQFNIFIEDVLKDFINYDYENENENLSTTNNSPHELIFKEGLLFNGIEEFINSEMNCFSLELTNKEINENGKTDKEKEELREKKITKCLRTKWKRTIKYTRKKIFKNIMKKLETKNKENRLKYNKGKHNLKFLFLFRYIY